MKKFIILFLLLILSGCALSSFEACTNQCLKINCDLTYNINPFEPDNSGYLCTNEKKIDMNLTQIIQNKCYLECKEVVR